MVELEIKSRYPGSKTSEAMNSHCSKCQPHMYRMEVFLLSIDQYAMKFIVLT